MGWVSREGAKEAKALVGFLTGFETFTTLQPALSGLE
jgi:hypothetical protein